MPLFYYNGAAYEKSLRRVIYIYQGLDSPGYKRVVYRQGRNIRGYRKPYDPKR